jgi:HAE1 family hydrophobic/amphiphilic exporter-1
MQKLAEVCIKRPVFATMIVMALVVVGAASWFRLGVDRFPVGRSAHRHRPRGAARRLDRRDGDDGRAEARGADQHIQGIQELRSISSPGNAIVIVTFVLSRQIDVAAQDVRDKVSIAQRNLPRDIRPPVISKTDNDQAPVITIALSGDRSIRELTELADKTVRPVLERSTGVGEVRLVGGLLRSVNVWVDADRLSAYQIPITSVRDADRPPERRPAGRQRDGRPQRGVAAHDGALRRSPRGSTTSSWPP